MADQLRKNGFVSNGGNDIQWFKLVEHEVIQSVYFYTRHPRLPMEMELGYGCHPAFLCPHFSNNPVIRIMPGYELLYPRYLISKSHNRPFYREDILVTCPADEHCGRDLLESVFPVLDACKTLESCYELHKSWLSGAIKNGSIHAASPEFVDEVLYWDDKKLFPYCLAYVQLTIRNLERARASASLSRRLQAELDYLHYLETILCNGDRKTHLDLLRNRKQRNLSLLKKHTGIEG
jgi:hypothetical protein